MLTHTMYWFLGGLKYYSSPLHMITLEVLVLGWGSQIVYSIT